MADLWKRLTRIGRVFYKKILGFMRNIFEAKRSGCIGLLLAKGFDFVFGGSPKVSCKFILIPSMNLSVFGVFRIASHDFSASLVVIFPESKQEPIRWSVTMASEESSLEFQRTDFCRVCSRDSVLVIRNQMRTNVLVSCLIISETKTSNVQTHNPCTWRKADKMFFFHIWPDLVGFKNLTRWNLSANSRKIKVIAIETNGDQW